MEGSPAALCKMAIKGRDQLEQNHLYRMGRSIADGEADHPIFPRSTNFYLDPENLGGDH